MPFKKGQSGNPNGRPKKPEIDLLREALEKAQQKHGMHFIEHFVEKAYADNTMAIALAKKILPDRVETEQPIDIKTTFIIPETRKDRLGQDIKAISI